MRLFNLFLWTFGLGLFCALAYGIVFDQFSVRNSPEYFTIGHPSTPVGLFEPHIQFTRLGLYWGVMATWWVGAGLGLIHGLWLMIFDRHIRLSALMLRHAFLLAFVSGIVATAWFMVPNMGLVPNQFIPAGFLNALTDEQVGPFLQNTFTHWAGYVSSAIGAIFLFGYAFAHGRFAPKKNLAG